MRAGFPQRNGLLRLDATGTDKVKRFLVRFPPPPLGAGRITQFTLIKNFVVEKFFPQTVGLVQENIRAVNRFPLFENNPA